MTLQTRSRYPGVSVVLFKNVGRQKLSGSGANAIPVSTRFSGQKSVIDVTKYLGEQGNIQTHKSVREPAGNFSIDFTDQLVVDEDDSIYGLFEPMDIVEIRIAANSYAYNSGSGAVTPDSTPNTVSSGSPLPIMMRGFISVISRSQAVGQDGRPARKVTISGQDYGKIWQMNRIYFNPWMPDNNNYITQYKLQTRFGLAFGIESSGSLVKGIVNKILNPFIANMKSKAKSSVSSGTSPLQPLSTAGVQIQGGNVAPFGVNDWQGGSIYDLLNTFCDAGVWNELYIDDWESGPTVVYRPNPFIKAGGDCTRTSDYINKNTILPLKVGPFDLTYIISYDVVRTDNNVANYYWVESPQYDMFFQFVGKAMAASGGPASTFIINNYGNVDPTLYGLKRMEERTNQGSLEQRYAGNTPASMNAKDGSVSLNWINGRRNALYEMNKDNVIFESGTIRLVGNENVRAGSYFLLKHGNMVSTYYVVSADHQLTPFGSYVTSINVERGTGFLDRSQKGTGTDSPYWSELADAQTP